MDTPVPWSLTLLLFGKATKVHIDLNVLDLGAGTGIQNTDILGQKF